MIRIAIRNVARNVMISARKPARLRNALRKRVQRSVRKRLAARRKRAKCWRFRIGSPCECGGFFVRQGF
jgi:hypothetical protein